MTCSRYEHGHRTVAGERAFERILAAGEELASIGCTLPLEEIYEKVTFAPDQSPG